MSKKEFFKPTKLTTTDKRFQEAFNSTNDTPKSLIQRQMSSNSPQMARRKPRHFLNILRSQLGSQDPQTHLTYQSRNSSYSSKRNPKSTLSALFKNVSKRKSRRKVNLGLNSTLNSKIPVFTRQSSLNSTHIHESDLNSLSKSTAWTNCFQRVKKSRSRTVLKLDINTACYPIGKNRNMKSLKKLKKLAQSRGKLKSKKISNELNLGPKQNDKIKIMSKLNVLSNAQNENTHDSSILKENIRYTNFDLEPATVYLSNKSVACKKASKRNLRKITDSMKLRKSQTQIEKQFFLPYSQIYSKQLTHNLDQLPNFSNLQSSLLSPIPSRKSTPKIKFYHNDMRTSMNSSNLSRMSTFAGRRSTRAQSIMNKIDQLRQSIDMSRKSVRMNLV